jgi:hypothetical protein
LAARPSAHLVALLGWVARVCGRCGAAVFLLLGGPLFTVRAIEHKVARGEHHSALALLLADIGFGLVAILLVWIGRGLRAAAYRADPTLRARAEQRRAEAMGRRRRAEVRQQTADEHAWTSWRRVEAIRAHRPSRPEHSHSAAGLVQPGIEYLPGARTPGTKAFVDLGPHVVTHDTYWPTAVGTPPVGSWVVLKGHIWDRDTHSGGPVFWVEQCLEILPRSVADAARRHEARATRLRSDAPQPPRDTESEPPRDAEPGQPHTTHEPAGKPPRPGPHPLQWAIDELELSPEFTSEDVNAAHRRLVKLHHPDRNQAYAEQAGEKTGRLNEAAEVLRAWLSDQREAA